MEDGHKIYFQMQKTKKSYITTKNEKHFHLLYERKIIQLFKKSCKQYIKVRDI